MEMILDLVKLFLNEGISTATSCVLTIRRVGLAMNGISLERDCG